MFYYGLDFHDLAPNFILNISAFIVVCEAFLRIKPHFGLWQGERAGELRRPAMIGMVFSGRSVGCLLKEGE